MIELSHKPLIRAYKGDCTGLMADAPDNHYDLACCDPPYGDQCNLQGGTSRTGGCGWSGLLRKQEWNVSPQSDYFREIIRISRNQVVWGANYFTEYLPPSMGWIFWDKGQRNFSLADGELAFTSFNRALRVFDYSRSRSNKEQRGRRIHPCQKPVSLYRWLLTNYAKTGQTIFDSHGGSFSSAIACWYEGYDLDICEIDEEYFDEACERFERETRQQKLFKPIGEFIE